MKKAVTITVIFSFLLFMVLTPNLRTIAAEEDYGSSGALEKENYTLEEMLIYAIQDEYLARAEYEKIMEIYDVQKPFSNIILSEENHIAMLKPLFSKHKIFLPRDNAAQHVIIPSSLLEAFKTGVQAEINNIAMYDQFIKQDLPADVESAFIKLRNASVNHLKAFENGVSRLEGSNKQDISGSENGGHRHQYRGGKP